MSDRKPLRVGVLGCGNISGQYCKTVAPYPEKVKVVGFYDLAADRAEQYAKDFGGKAYASIDDLVADPDIDLVLNLTIHHAHYETTLQALNAGKHVFCEKPLSLKYSEAKELVETAKAKGVILAGAPMTFMGEAQQTAWKQIRDGAVGTPRLVYAEVNHGRIEAWHPAPGPFYAVGPLWDVGVYPLTLATTFFGPAKRIVTSFQQVLYPDRVTQDGTEFHIDTPDLTIAVIELASGVLVRLTTNFYVHGKNTHQKGNFEVHGDKGSVVLGNFQQFGATVEASDFNEDLHPVELVREAPEGTEWGRSVVEFSDALHEGRDPRVKGAQAAHIVEILEAITTAAQQGKPVALTSSFDPPTPMDWAK